MGEGASKISNKYLRNKHQPQCRLNPHGLHYKLSSKAALSTQGLCPLPSPASGFLTLDGSEDPSLTPALGFQVLC